MMCVLARAAVTDDIPEVVRIASFMFEAIGLQVDKAWIDAAGDALRARLDRDACVYVVEDPDDPRRLVSVAAASIQHRLPVPGRLSGKTAYVQWVSTDPAWRRRGASRAAMLSVVTWCDEQGADVIELHATPDGEPLYRSMDFTEPPAKNLRRFHAAVGRSSR